VNARVWTAAEARAKFSQVIDQPQNHGPQTVTKNGRNAVVVVSAEAWERKIRRTGNLATFLAESPLRDSELDIRRVQNGRREIDL
jgi:prevent-host-death family protein